jgi:hypothetical protein
MVLRDGNETLPVYLALVTHADYRCVQAYVDSHSCSKKQARHVPRIES